MGFSIKSKFFTSLSALVLLLSFSSLAHAAEAETGRVRLWVGANFVKVYNANPPAAGTGTARCTGGYVGGMDLIITTDFGKAIYSKLLAAEAAGQSVGFWYTYNSSNATCTLDSVSS